MADSIVANLVEEIITPAIVEEIIQVNFDAGVFYSGGSTPPISQAFNAVTSISITHNKGYIPDVIVLDALNTELLCQITHPSNNQFTVSFTNPETGTIIYS